MLSATEEKDPAYT